jgi:hypothetical protein
VKHHIVGTSLAALTQRGVAPDRRMNSSDIHTTSGTEV